MHKWFKYYLGIAFIEGAAVMAVELTGAKLIAPWFGTSLYVWASVLGVTMMGLAGGYFMGGWLSERMKGTGVLFTVLTAAAVFTGIMPVIGPIIMEATLPWELRWGSLISALVFILPAMFSLGMVSPLLIRICSLTAEKAGRVSGIIYATSTIGGVITTFLMGFWLIPNLGLEKPIFIFAGLLIIPVLTAAVMRKRGLVPAITAAAILVLSVVITFAAGSKRHPGNVLYASDGMMGEITVQEEETRKGEARTVYINGLPQTIEMKETNCSGHTYVNEISLLGSMFPANSRTLMLGLGGGSLFKELLALGHDIDGCEIDPRIMEVAKEWFGVPLEKGNVETGDARHFINELDQPYDLMVLDVFFGDNPPWQVITVEALTRLRENLRPGGLMVIYFPGPILGPEGVPAQGLINTMRAADFEVAVVSTGVQGKGGRIFLGTHKRFDYRNFGQPRPTPCVQSSGLQKYLPLIYDFDFSSDLIFSDERPILETLWRPRKFNRKI